MSCKAQAPRKSDKNRDYGAMRARQGLQIARECEVVNVDDERSEECLGCAG